jgi:transcriptional activator
VLKVAPEAIDAMEVLRLAGEATKSRARDPAAALALCTTALAMFHGDVLPDAGDGEWIVPHRVRLEEAPLGLVETNLRLDSISVVPARSSLQHPPDFGRLDASVAVPCRCEDHCRHRRRHRSGL